MSEKPDMLTIEELIMSLTIRLSAMTRLMERKRLLTEDEIQEEIGKLRAESEQQMRDRAAVRQSEQQHSSPSNSKAI